MKSLLLISAIFTSGSAVAITNDTAQEKIDENIHRLREMFEHKNGYDFDSIREQGYPYPKEERLEEMTEEQRFEIVSYIDQVNATYDFASMDDEELEETLELIRDELRVIYEELGLEYFYGHPGERGLRNARRAHGRKGHHRGRSNRIDFDSIREEGLQYPNEERLEGLTEEQRFEITSYIDQVNATYDFSSMDDEELKDTLKLIKGELHELYESYEENDSEEVTEEETEEDTEATTEEETSA